MARDQDMDVEFEKRLRAIGYAVEYLSQQKDVPVEGRLRLDEVRVKLDADNRTSVLVVLKGTQDGMRVVGFVGGLDMGSVLIAARKKIQADALRWRADRPWSPGASGGSE